MALENFRISAASFCWRSISAFSRSRIWLMASVTRPNSSFRLDGVLGLSSVSGFEVVFSEKSRA